jgi:hypothetical protein
MPSSVRPFPRDASHSNADHKMTEHHEFERLLFIASTLQAFLRLQPLDAAPPAPAHHVTRASSSTSQYCSDCNAKPQRIRPMPKTPSQRSGRLSAKYSI